YPSAMPKIRLPDGKTVDLAEGEPVGSALDGSAIAARVDGQLRDLSYVPESESAVEAVDPSSADGLHVLRHSSAHVMARAVCELWPGTRYAIGPAVADGFYYDLEPPEPISSDDLARVEDRMRKVVGSDEPFIREEIPRADALERFRDQPYKTEIIQSLGTEK